jgi:hypothetical protein
MAYTNGEYIEKFILPGLVHTLQNLKQDFLAVIPNAPAKALNSSGIVKHLIGQPISVDWDKSDAYEDVDIATFDIKNDLIPWQYFSTTPFEVTKEEIRTSALNRGGILAQKSSEAIAASWIEKNIHNLAPDDDTDDVFNPVINTTGADRGDGRKRMLVTDLVGFREPFNKLNLLKPNELHMILCPEHLTDLMLDALQYQAFRDIYTKTESGEPMANHGWKFFWNTYKNHYSAAGAKLAYGAAVGGTDVPASTVFYAPHTIKSIANITHHYKSLEEDTRNNPPKTEMRFTGNATIGKLYDLGFGAIKSGV